MKAVQKFNNGHLFNPSNTVTRLDGTLMATFQKRLLFSANSLGSHKMRLLKQRKNNAFIPDSW